MIWLATLDPANLALNIDTSILNISAKGRVISNALLCCALGDRKGCLAHLDHLESRNDRARCAYLVSTVWHEQRHFVDLILTNYGNYTFRQFTTLYANAYAILQDLASRSQEISFPLDIYIDPVRRRIAEKLPMSESTEEVIRDLKAREKYIIQDRLKFDVNIPEMSGHAQLEAIGTIFQIGALENNIREYTGELGEDIYSLFRESTINIEKYNWFHQLGGIFDFKRVQINEQRTVEKVGFFPLLLYVSLSTRTWFKDNPDYQDKRNSPLGRFTRIIEYAEENKGKFNTSDFEEMWFNTNAMATKLFGRTIPEEIEVDIYFQAENLQNQIESGIKPLFIAIQEDHLALRKHLFDILQKDPEMLLGPDKYSKIVLDRVFPIPIINYPQSVPESVFPENKWQSICSAIFQDGKDSQTKYAWSFMPGDWATTDKIGFRNPAAWKELFHFWTPFAKAALKGRNHRTMLGPEFLNMEATLQEVGLAPRYEAEFEYPHILSLPATHFYNISGLDNATCDICHTKLSSPDGHLLSPWIFRKTDEIKNMTIKMLGGNKDAERKFHFDWSPWFVCDKCNAWMYSLAE